MARTESTATLLFTLPRFCRITEIIVISAAASVGATISLGTDTTTPNEYVNAQSVATVGHNRPATTGTVYTTLSAMADVYGLIGGAPGAGGPFRVIFLCTSEKKTG
jgi:hypothetical protein